MIKWILISLLLFPVSISASTGSSSIEFISISSPFLPILSIFTLFTLFTVVYAYIVTLKDVSKSKGLVLAFIIWLTALGFILYTFKDLFILSCSVLMCLISYIIILIVSLRKR